MRPEARAWDAYDAYLFDIDGTLLNCADAVHYFAFCNVLTKLCGRPMTLDGVTAHGNTDRGILRDTLRLAGMDEQNWRPHLPEICADMCDFVEARAGELCVSAMPQVHKVLGHLRARGARLGVATGNLARIGKVKLKRAGLLSYFEFAGWSDAFELRADVVQAAAAEARRRAGADARVCVVGDTPADIRAARANQLAVIAVATGVHGFEELAAEMPDRCVSTFAELLQSPCTPATEQRMTISSN